MRFIKAVKIFNGSGFLEESDVLVFQDDGTFREVAGGAQVPADRIEFLDGLLTPGFVNAHCHLELSHLRGVLKRGTGFCDFAIELMARRYAGDKGLADEAMSEAEREMLDGGIVAVGDISNSAASFNAKSRGRLFYHTFVELIALDPSRADAVLLAGQSLLATLHDMGLHGSLAAHAPYSVSLRLMALIAAHDRGKDLPFTIHNQESPEETLFFLGQKSKVEDLYRHLGIDISWFRPPGTSSLSSYAGLLCDVRSLLVHNTCTDAADIEAVAANNIYWCLCPGANLFIEDRLPDFSLFREFATQLCVGTDSLASNNVLDVLQELNLIAEAAPFFTEEQLLRMVTSNGARSLGLDHTYGHFVPGKKPGLNLITRNGTKFEYIKRLF